MTLGDNPGTRSGLKCQHVAEDLNDSVGKTQRDEFTRFYEDYELNFKT